MDVVGCSEKINRVSLRVGIGKRCVYSLTGKVTWNSVSTLQIPQVLTKISFMDRF